MCRLLQRRARVLFGELNPDESTGQSQQVESPLGHSDCIASPLRCIPAIGNRLQNIALPLAARGGGNFTQCLIMIAMEIPLLLPGRR
jgi:hypothetical protein